MRSKYTILFWRPPKSTFAWHIYQRVISHAATVVPECIKHDDASQWKSGKFDPLPQKTPKAIVI